MAGNTWGQALRLTSWGESHGPAIGGVLDGVPPGIAIDLDQLQYYLDLRRPGRQKNTSPRQEDDRLQILSGVFEGKTLGTPLAFMIANKDQRPQDYDHLCNIYRPGHADYTYQKKYGIRDHRGGGRASARETAARVAAGAVAHQALKQMLGDGFRVLVAVEQIGSISCWPDQQITQTAGSAAMQTEPFLSLNESALEQQYFAAHPAIIPYWHEGLEKARQAGKSLGTRLAFAVEGVPAGLGEPVFGKLDAEIAAALMSINAAKAVSIGDGEGAAEAEQGYDELAAGEQFMSNRAGGILGGISSGQPITGTVTFKPTSSTTQSRQTVDSDDNTRTIRIAGRHDPCVGIRAVPIVWGMLNLVALDHLLRWRGQCG